VLLDTDVASTLFKRKPLPVLTRLSGHTWIAATALVYQLPLATLNLKDYEDIHLQRRLQIIHA
jgi:predicted nucleic acid-binding protein